MENQNSKILSFEEFLNQGDQHQADDTNQEMPELPAADNDPAGDAPIVDDLEIATDPVEELAATEDDTLQDEPVSEEEEEEFLPEEPQA